MAASVPIQGLTPEKLLHLMPEGATLAEARKVVSAAHNRNHRLEAPIRINGRCTSRSRAAAVGGEWERAAGVGVGVSGSTPSAGAHHRELRSCDCHSVNEE